MTAIGSASHVKVTNPLRIGLIGARSWVANQAVIPAIEASASCVLVAVGSSGGPVPQHLAHLDTGGYDRVLAHPDVEAVYVPLSNDQHRPWVERAAMAGKHVLCEKPLGLDGADAAAMVAVCEGAGVVLAEAWMTPFGARWAEIVGRAATGQLGEIRHLAATFTFPLDPKQTDNYRWNPGQGGGALLDVGIYALGAAVALWGAEPSIVHAAASRGVTGVDLSTSAWCQWDASRTASILVSFELPECQRLEVVGTSGRMVAEGSAFTGGPLATSYAFEASNGDTSPVPVVGNDPYLHMLDAFADAVRSRRPWPRSPAETVAMACLLDRVRQAGR